MKKNKNQMLVGFVKRHPDGFGFFIPDDKEFPDVYLPRQEMHGIMTNDRVEIHVSPEKDQSRLRGQLSKIVERKTKSVIGILQKKSSQYFLKDESFAWGSDLKITDAANLNDFVGQLVVVDITSFPEEKDGFVGVVSKALGSAANPLNDIQKVIIQNQLPAKFSQACLTEAKNFVEEVQPKDKVGRVDLTEMSFITIDGATAKDFDDAILVQTKNTGFQLWVAIADVSHYVKPQSAIDKDAYERGTSVYFPNFVVPMLPEVLSNGLCSLNPKVDRLSLVAEMHFDFEGHMTTSKFYEAVINSKARVTYGEAQEVIDGADTPKLKHVKKEILVAADLAKILMAKRFKEGSLDLEIPEVQVLVDSEGNPTDMIRSERLFAHRLIEEMMLAANVAVAKFLDSKNIPSIYRIHEPPNPDAIQMLEKYLWNFGSKTKISGPMNLQKKLTKSLQEFSGKPEAQVLNILTLRSMSQAKYSVQNLGHFGLGFDYYTHFTSPIRRYPDLIVHRLIKSQILKGKKYQPQDEEKLQTAALMLSACEQRSTKAERQLISIKKARFMEQHIDKEFDGMISSVTKFGVFVLLREFEVDGLVHVEKLSKEKMHFDEDTLTLRGSRSGLSFSIGDPIKVKVTTTNVDAGQVDFDLVKPIGSKTKEASSKQERESGRRKDLRRPKPTEVDPPEVESAKPSGRFDPAAHFDRVMKLWKQRNVPKGSDSKNDKYRSFGSSNNRPERASNNRSEGSSNNRSERASNDRSEGSAPDRSDKPQKPGKFFDRINRSKSSSKPGNKKKSEKDKNKGFRKKRR